MFIDGRGYRQEFADIGHKDFRVWAVWRMQVAVAAPTRMGMRSLQFCLDIEKELVAVAAPTRMGMRR